VIDHRTRWAYVWDIAAELMQIMVHPLSLKEDTIDIFSKFNFQGYYKVTIENYNHIKYILR